MRCLYVCNNTSDSVLKLDTYNFSVLNSISLKESSIDRIGPHGIFFYENNIFTANNYSNGVSIINTLNDEKQEHQYIGANCNDIFVFDSKAYIACGDSNSLFVYSLYSKKIIEEIPCGNFPHSISFDYKNKIMLITNMVNDSITLIDCKYKANLNTIKVGAYPTKALFSVDSSYIYVCESNIGGYERGSISILSAKDYRILNRIMVGYSPVDMYCYKDFLYVSNFGEGTISIISLKNRENIKKINIGGMPRGIMVTGEHLFVGDSYNNYVIRVNLKNETKKNISIGGEPTGMILV